MIFVGIAFGIIPILIAKLIAPAAPNDQKSAPYECGFPPSQNARTPFNIKFYLMAILFILFDVETSFLFPWAVSLDTIGLTGYLNMLGFLAILIAGFIYEWQRGALEWS
tara:strand:- start:922 stop:1248 length:327 start_codon:yes stop_codon:yes gene_type:complete